MTKDEMPVGVAMALAMNPKAMQKLEVLREEQKQAIIEGTHAVKSREEMHQYVNNLVSNKQADTKA